MSKSKPICCLLLLICLVGPGSAGSQPMRYNLEEKRWLDRHQTLHIGVVEQNPPLLFYTGGSNPQGLVADYLRALALHLGMQLEVERYADWAEMGRALRLGDVDAVGAWPAGWSRAEPMITSRPYLTLPVALYGASEISVAGGLPSLRGKKLAVVRGSVWERLTQIEPDLQVTSYPTLKQALRAAADGRAFAYIGDAASVDYLLERESFGDLELQSRLDLTYDLALATRQGDSALLSLLQKGLDRIGPDELQEIWYRWPGVERPQQFSREILAVWLWVPLILAWSGLLVWGVYRYVARKEDLRYAKLKQLIRRFQRREKQLKEKLLTLKHKALEYRGETRRQTHRLDLMDQVMPSATWVWEPATGCCQWDERMFALYQQDPGYFEPTPEAILDLVHADDREQVAALYRKLEEESESRLSYRVTLPDGRIRWLLDFSQYSVAQEDGAEQRVGLCWDITDYLMPSASQPPQSVES